jgi:hypothetical protein
MKTEQIYIFLQDENVDVWRPVDAMPRGELIFKIPENTQIPETEQWEFQPGQTVRCERKILSVGPCLVAVEEIKEGQRH